MYPWVSPWDSTCSSVQAAVRRQLEIPGTELTLSTAFTYYAAPHLYFFLLYCIYFLLSSLCVGVPWFFVEVRGQLSRELLLSFTMWVTGMEQAVTLVSTISTS